MDGGRKLQPLQNFYHFNHLVCSLCPLTLLLKDKTIHNCATELVKFTSENILSKINIQVAVWKKILFIMPSQLIKQKNKLSLNRCLRHIIRVRSGALVSRNPTYTCFRTTYELKKSVGIRTFEIQYQITIGDSTISPRSKLMKTTSVVVLLFTGQWWWRKW